MEFGSPRIVRIPSGNDTAPAGTAAAGGQIGIIKQDALICEPVNIGCSYPGIPITSKIINWNIVGEYKYEIRCEFFRTATKQATHTK